MKDAAVLVLYNKEGRLYLQHRTAYKERWANYWGTFGGGVEEGESVEEALEREIMEELSYCARKYKKIFTQLFETGATKHVFIESYDDTQTLCPDENECQNSGWFFFEETTDLELIPHDREAIARISEYLREKGVV